jgi:hypothetical protein
VTALLSIVVVNWNSGSQLRQCLGSIEEVVATDDVQPDVAVVDNASTDGSADSLGEYSFVLTILRERTNRGFARACNVGARETQGEYVLFLNPDTRLLPGSLRQPLAFMANTRREHVGIVGVGLVDAEGRIQPTCSRFLNAQQAVVHALGLDRLFPRRFKGQVMLEWNHRGTRAVDQVIGAFFLVRRKVFNDLGGFDERFFLYFEEVDFSLRARQAGWSSYYLPSARAYHRGGGTTDQVRARRLFYSLRSRILYAFKHFEGPSASLVLLTTLFVEPVTRIGYAVTQRSLTTVKDTIVAYMLLYSALPRMAIDWVRSDGDISEAD